MDEKEINMEDKKVKVIKFRKNFGQTAAISAGFDYSKGDVIISMDGLLSYSTRPLQLFGIPGIISFFAGFVIGAYLTIERLFFGMGLADRPLLLLAVLLVFLGVQFITMGLLGEVIARTYYEIQGKPIYVVKEIIE